MGGKRAYCSLSGGGLELRLGFGPRSESRKHLPKDQVHCPADELAVRWRKWDGGFSADFGGDGNGAERRE